MAALNEPEFAVPELPEHFPYRRELRGCDRLWDFTKAHIVEHFVPMPSVVDDIVMSELARAGTTYRSIMHLAIGGYGVQAEALTRTAFEGCLSALWASRNPTAVEERWELHSTYVNNHYLTARASTPFYPNDPSPAPMTTGELELARKLFGKYAERPWTGLSTRELANDALLSASKDYKAIVRPR